MLKGRTLPAEFFERAKRLSSPLHISVPGKSPARSEMLFMSPKIVSPSSSTMSMNAWNVCVFLDLRASSENDLPIALLPLPEEPCIFVLHQRHFQMCKSVFVLVQPHHYHMFTRWVAPPNITLVVADANMPVQNMIRCIRETFTKQWEVDTITLWWESAVVLEHQILWRPNVEKYETCCFVGENGIKIATAWQPTVTFPNFPDMHSIRCSQKVWRIIGDREYMEFVHHKLALLGWEKK